MLLYCCSVMLLSSPSEPHPTLVPPPSFLPVQSLAFVVKAFAHLRYRPPPAFMAHLVTVSLRRLSDFNIHELAMLVYGMSRLSYRQPRLYQAVAQQVMVSR